MDADFAVLPDSEICPEELNDESFHLPTSIHNSKMEDKTLSSAMEINQTDDQSSDVKADDFQADDNSYLTLDTLPPEVFLTICSYLPATFILTRLTLVCKAFRDLLMDDATWKIRISKRCQKRYPRVPVENFDWKLACMEREDTAHNWSNPDANIESYSLHKNVFAAVDVVHLMDNGQLLVSGSRDRHLTFWDLKQLHPDNPDYEDQTKVLTKINAHKGWIWTAASRGHFVATGAWDASVKLWDVGPNCEEIRHIPCKSAILCLEYVDNVLFAGGYDKHTYQIDARTGSITHRLRHHRRSVLCLSADKDYIVTGSEDNTVCVYDLRAGKLFKTLALDHFPMSMCRAQNQLLVGDKQGLVHLIDASQGKFEMVKTYEFGHSGRVTGISHGYGCTITSSVDRSVRIMEPCDIPACLHTIKLHTQEVAGGLCFKTDHNISDGYDTYCEDAEAIHRFFITRFSPQRMIDYQSGTLVSAGSDCQIGVWRPKHNRQD